MTTLPDAKLYIDGKLRDATGGRSYDLISPWTGEPVGKAADATKEDVEEAITAARRAFDETNWSSPENRQTRFELVKKLRELFQENYDRLGDLAVHEAGAARGAVDRAHVAMALDGWDDYLDVFKNVEWEKDYGEKNAFGAMHKRIAVREPVGVVAAITPWNVPLYVNIGKVVAALLAGSARERDADLPSRAWFVATSTSSPLDSGSLRKRQSAIVLARDSRSSPAIRLLRRWPW